MKYFFVLLVVCTLPFSCKKSIVTNQFLQCDKAQTFDSTITSGKLVGTWKLIKQRYGSNGKVAVPEEKVTVTFNSNATFKIWKNSTVMTEGNWRIKKLNDKWALDMDPFNYYLDGVILFCNNQVVFSANFYDGNDNLYEKTD